MLSITSLYNYWLRCYHKHIKLSDMQISVKIEAGFRICCTYIHFDKNSQYSLYGTWQNNVTGRNKELRGTQKWTAKRYFMCVLYHEMHKHERLNYQKHHWKSNLRAHCRKNLVSRNGPSKSMQVLNTRYQTSKGQLVAKSGYPYKLPRSTGIG